MAGRLKNIKADLVLSIPRGGVVVASEIAKFLKIPMDIIVTRKIGAPNHEELALGAVDPDGETVWDDELMSRYASINLKNQIEKAWKEVKRRDDLYRQGRVSVSFENKTVIVTDDGMATGATVLSAVKYLKRHGAKVILAVPVASKEALSKVKNDCEKAVVLEAPEYFGAVAQFYGEFEPVSDEEVIQYLK